MNRIIFPSDISGEILAPASKSVFQRLVVAALLSEGTTTIHNISYCNDANSAMEMAESLGAKVKIENNSVTITGGFSVKKSTINAGESGLGIRLFTSVASLHKGQIKVEGRGSLKTRPMQEFETILSQVGVEVNTNNGLLPITVKGRTKGGVLKMDGSLSSQFLSGLLMTLPVCENDSTIHVSNLKSIPYIEMTLEVLRQFGIEVTHTNFEIFKIKGNQKYRGQEIACPGDWSGAAALFVAGAVASSNGIKVSGLFSNYYQADQEIVSLFQKMNMNMTFEEGIYNIKKSTFQGFTFNATHCPDLFPVLAALACFAKSKSTILGVDRLKHKESDRGLAIQQELSKAGIQVDINGDEMVIHPSEIHACTIDSHNDHRIAMLGAVIGLAGAEVNILNTECVNKSYPNFFNDLEGLL